MNWEGFRRWFNRDFWRAFKDRTFPIKTPGSQQEREDAVRRVYESIKTGRYAPSIPEAEIVMNKGNGVARTVPVFCIEDYIVFYFCIKELEDILCGTRTNNTFGGWALGGKLRKQEALDVEIEHGFSSSRYSFNPRAWIEAFGEFNALLFAQLDTGLYPHVLQFDLSNFYDSIRLDILERWIREDSDASKGWIIALLFYFLNQWNRKNTGLHAQAVGVPQDALADCSRLLANFYLQRYDRFAFQRCTEAGAVYFRYADDQMILLKSKAPIEELMLLLTRHLDRFGLRVNQKKVELWETRELEENRCRQIQSIFSKKGDNQNKVLVRKFVEAYLSMPKHELGQTWNGGLPLLNRLLWAKLESLPSRLLNRMLARYTRKDYLLRADYKKMLRIAQLNDLRAQPVDLATALKQIGDKAVHNAFHYEVISFAKASNAIKLRKHFERRLTEITLLMEHNIVP